MKVNRVLLYVLAVLAVIATLGWSGRLAVGHQYSLDFVIVILWLYCWLAELELALLFAVTAGLLLDFVSFLPFGVWTAVLAGITLITHGLRTRYLAISSFWQAVATLAAASLLYHLAVGIIVQAVYPYQVLVSMLLNVLVGALLYYLLVIRFRLLQRWRGQQLS